MVKKVALITGGVGPEREASLRSVSLVLPALKSLGYETEVIDFHPDTIIDNLRNAKPDIAYVRVDGIYGEDGRIPGLLDIMGIPYTHSGVLASAIAKDKFRVKKLFRSKNILCPESVVIHKDTPDKKAILKEKGITAPFVIKPVNEGSSVGMRIVKAGENFDIDSYDFKTFDRLLVERFIPGKELTVAIMGDRALGAMEIRPKGGVFDFETKYKQGGAVHVIPPDIDKKALQYVLDAALKAHKTLGCNGISRSDFIYDAQSGKAYMLELNVNPAFTAQSLFPEIAAYAGVSVEDIVQHLIDNAKYLDEERTARPYKIDTQKDSFAEQSKNHKGNDTDTPPTNIEKYRKSSQQFLERSTGTESSVDRLQRRTAPSRGRL